MAGVVLLSSGNWYRVPGIQARMWARWARLPGGALGAIATAAAPGIGTTTIASAAAGNAKQARARSQEKSEARVTVFAKILTRTRPLGRAQGGVIPSPPRVTQFHSTPSRLLAMMH